MKSEEDPVHRIRAGMDQAAQGNKEMVPLLYSFYHECKSAGMPLSMAQSLTEILFGYYLRPIPPPSLFFAARPDDDDEGDKS